jgi:hypothetical protein
MKKYKHYSSLKKTLKKILDSHNKWYSTEGPFASNPNGDRIFNLYDKEIISSFFTEYLQYKETNYFFGCSFQVYKKTYNQRLKDYLANFFDTDEISFIKDELDEGIYNYKFKEFDLGCFDKNIILKYERNKKQINHSLTKRLEYLSQRSKENGYDLVYNKSSETYSLARIKQLLEVKKEEDLIDYSTSSLAEKIIALNEGGVINFLKEKEPFNTSTNSLAGYLSLCLGEKTTSIQSYIQPLINKDNDQSKSPYTTTGTVKRVQQKLINIGLKIE